MGIPQEASARLVVKHTFLEFVDQHIGQPRPRTFTDSALEAADSASWPNALRPDIQSQVEEPVVALTGYTPAAPSKLRLMGDEGSPASLPVEPSQIYKSPSLPPTVRSPPMTPSLAPVQEHPTLEGSKDFLSQADAATMWQGNDGGWVPASYFMLTPVDAQTQVSANSPASWGNPWQSGQASQLPETNGNQTLYMEQCVEQRRPPQRRQQLQQLQQQQLQQQQLQQQQQQQRSQQHQQQQRRQLQQQELQHQLEQQLQLQQQHQLQQQRQQLQQERRQLEQQLQQQQEHQQKREKVADRLHFDKLVYGAFGTNSATADEDDGGSGGFRTTVMLRNLPNCYTRSKLLELLDAEGFAGRYDFVYLPIDFTSTVSLGYAFVDLISPADADNFVQHFRGFTKWESTSEKVCTVNWSNPHQGLQQHIDRYRNSPVMHNAIPDEWKPIIIIDGARVAFPPPTKPIKAPKLRNRPGDTSVVAMPVAGRITSVARI